MPVSSLSSGPVPPARRPSPVVPPASDLGRFARRATVAVLIVVLIGSLTYVVWKEIHVLLEAFAGLLFAVFLSALSEWLSQRLHMRYGWALTVVLLALLVLLGGTGWLLASRLSAQVGELSQKVPQSLAQIRDYLVQSTLGRLLVEQVPQDVTPLAQEGLLPRLLQVISGGINFITAAVVILFVGVFGAAEPRIYKEGVFTLVPPRYRARVEEAMQAVDFNLRWWLVGQVFLMVVIGVTTGVSLWLIGIPLALVLGILAGLLELVPYVGPFLSAIPAILVALLVSPVHVLIVIGLYIGLHILEGYVLGPLVQRRAVLLPPALTLVMQVLLGDMFGILGLFVAAPLTVTLVVLLKMLYVEDTLGDESVNVPGEPGNERDGGAAAANRA